MEQQQFSERPWFRKIERLLTLGQKSRALQVLDKAVESDMPLFWVGYTELTFCAIGEGIPKRWPGPVLNVS